MRTSLCLLTLVVGMPFAFADDAPWPMPSPLPPLPTASETTKPVPRIEWLQQAQGFFDEAKENADSIHIVFDGDSITRGWMGGNGRAIWNEYFGSRGAFDFAIGGDATQHVLWRLSQGQMDGLNPRLVVLLIGTNNMRTSTPEQIADGVRAIVEEYRRRCPNAVVLVQAIFPRGQNPDDPLRDMVKKTNQLIARLDDGEKVIFRDFGDRFLEPDGKISADIMPDFLHLTAKGYQIWADALLPDIERYVGGKSEK